MLTRPEGQSPRRRRNRSDPEQPEITFGWEMLSAVVREARPLLAREHAEVQTDERLVFDPDWDRLFGWAAAGHLGIWTTRADDVLIGYASVLFMRHLYSQEWRMANIHTPYLAPEWRRGRLGIEMFQTLFAALKDSGVQIVEIDLDKDSPLHRILDRMQFDAPEITRRKFL